MKKKKNLLVLAIVLGSIALLVGGITFAYYLAGLTGNGNDADEVEVNTISLGTIVYDDVDAFNSNDMYPGEIGITSFTIKKGSQSGSGTYRVVLNGSIDSEFGPDVKISLYKSTNGNSVSVTPGSLTTSGNVIKADTLVVGNGVEKVYGPYMLMNNNVKVLEEVNFDTATLADTAYYLVYEYKNNEIASQNDQMGHNFSGKVSVEIVTGQETTNECNYAGNLVKGVEYVNGQYTYRYKEEPSYMMDMTCNLGTCTQEITRVWETLSDDGWSVYLTNSELTEPVTTKLCTSINEKPIISMTNMFRDSQATSVDLSNFDTTNVTNMSHMFYGVKTPNIDLSNLDTSSVVDMSNMFQKSETTSIDLSTLNTTNVTNMSGMFYESNFQILNLGSFNTSNVTNMAAMFRESHAEIIDLSNFNITQNPAMGNMFKDCLATVGYAGTEDDANTFNDSDITEIPSTLTFVVKPTN